MGVLGEGGADGPSPMRTRRAPCKFSRTVSHIWPLLLFWDCILSGSMLLCPLVVFVFYVHNRHVQLLLPYYRWDRFRGFKLIRQQKFKCLRNSWSLILRFLLLPFQFWGKYPFTSGQNPSHISQRDQIIIILPVLSSVEEKKATNWRFRDRLGGLPAQDPSQSQPRAESGSLVLMLISKLKWGYTFPTAEPLLYIHATCVKSVKTQAVSSLFYEGSGARSSWTEVGEGESWKLL